VTLQNNLQVLGTNQQVGVALLGREIDYQDWALLWKIGISTQLEGWDLGVTVTTPRISFAGGGATGFDQTAAGPGIDELATNTQTDLSVDYTSPFSIAVGGAYGLGATRVHVATEWFAPVDPYVLVDSQPFVGQTSGETIGGPVTTELTDVLNLAVGLEHEFSETLTAYGSFRTDFSAIEPDSAATFVLADWDIHHVAGGATFTVGRSEFTAGAVVAFGNSTSGALFDRLGDDTVITEPAKLSYFRLSFILGFSFSFQ
jgi:long-subunit fatty acid transport protein